MDEEEEEYDERLLVGAGIPPIPGPSLKTEVRLARNVGSKPAMHALKHEGSIWAIAVMDGGGAQPPVWGAPPHPREHTLLSLLPEAPALLSLLPEAPALLVLLPEAPALPRPLRILRLSERFIQNRFPDSMADVVELLSSDDERALRDGERR